MDVRRAVTLAWGDRDLTTDFRGVRMTVPGDEWYFRAGVGGGFYEAIELDLLERLAAGSAMTIDVGANIGIYACVAASRMPADGRLVAFEPTPRNVEYLRRNLAANGLTDRVRVEPMAVSDQPGELLLHLNASSGANNSLAAGTVPKSAGAMPVPVTSLDAYLAETMPGTPVDLMKIDVEGYDGHVLRGAVDTLRAYRPALLVEYVTACLARAGFAAAEYLDIVFSIYPHVFLINEPRRRLEPCTRAELIRYVDAMVDLNLVAVARPEHLDLVRRYGQPD